ncbi:MAG: hypothetical protein KGK07_13475 [Chloroflexota bacterium]|nr:hypothetical protein [Chloroflexota bacterium]
MEGHFHHDAVEIVFIGLSALLVFNLIRLVAAQLAKGPGLIGQIGLAAGGLAT